MISKILISSCLLGNAVRYNATDLKQDNDYLNQWLDENRLVGFCPEVSGGMSIPRAAAEIVGGTAEDVLNGQAEVIDNTSKIVSEYFINGATKALDLCMEHRIKIAILTERSPSCGSTMVYDGTFNNNRILGEGVTTALLRLHGIEVFNQYECEKVKLLLE